MRKASPSSVSDPPSASISCRAHEGSEVLELLAEDHRCRVTDHGRDDDLGLLGAKLDAVDAAVPRRAESKRSERPLDPRTVGPQRGALAGRGGALADQRGRLVDELARVRVDELRLVPPVLDPRDEREILEQLRQLLRSGEDHLDVAVGRLAEVVEALQGVREARNRGQRRAQVMAGQGNQTGEPVVYSQETPC